MKIVVGVALLATLAAGCGDDSSDNPLETKPSPAGAGKTVVVGSAGFPENVLLGEIYAGALEAKGVKVEKKLNLGTREVIYNQLKSGGLTVLPEYNGALLAYLDKNAALPTTTEDTDKAVAAKLPAGLKLLEPSPAQDNDSLTVTAETATKNNLKTIEDLKPVAGTFTVGGPPTFEGRFKDKLKEVYGLTFKGWTPDRSEGANVPTWLKSNKVQVGNIFTTTPAIVINKLVVLEDPKGVFGQQNITPLVNTAGLDAAAEAALNAVSAKLTTDDLLGLMKQIAIDKADPAEVAKTWLAAHP
ncbi:MAG: ABC transporter substrate-binding protein [Streptosporangiaceae bacterium]